MDSGDTLTYSLGSTAPGGATIGSTSGFFQWTPIETQGPGIYTFDVCVTDSALSKVCDSVTLTIAEINLNPVLSALSASRSVMETNNLTFTAAATDSDLPANTLTFSLDRYGTFRREH